MSFNYIINKWGLGMGIGDWGFGIDNKGNLSYYMNLYKEAEQISIFIQ